MFYLKQGNCLDVIPVLVKDGIYVDGIITTVPHNFDNFIELFQLYDSILKENGTVLFHFKNPDDFSYPYILTNKIQNETNFSIVDTLIWCIPEITEFVLVFVRKSETQTYKSNKKTPKYIESNDKCELTNELILTYYQSGDTVMDNFSGDGATMVS
jgi:DNA modification methylase